LGDFLVKLAQMILLKKVYMIVTVWTVGKGQRSLGEVILSPSDDIQEPGPVFERQLPTNKENQQVRK
jgi:hypothetical protein